MDCQSKLGARARLLVVAWLVCVWLCGARLFSRRDLPATSAFQFRRSCRSRLGSGGISRHGRRYGLLGVCGCPCRPGFGRPERAASSSAVFRFGQSAVCSPQIQFFACACHCARPARVGLTRFKGRTRCVLWPCFEEILCSFRPHFRRPFEGASEMRRPPLLHSR